LKKQWQDLITSLTAPIGNPKKKWTNKGCVTYTVALPFTLKSNYLKAKKEEELWKLKYFTLRKL
jgi:hypothetical protein